MPVDSIQENKLRLLGKLTASLIHEIRNPLSAIKLNLDLIEYYENELSEEVRESFIDCSKATVRIEELVENLLHYARKSNNVLQLTSVADITNYAVDLLKVKAAKMRIQLLCELQDSLPLIKLNDNKILQVFLNLITNALEACDSNGAVIVRAFMTNIDEKEVLNWEVEDNGVGISESDQGKIFEDFFTSKTKGTGLGLSVCKSILDEMGAELDFRSSESEGTTFIIRFYPRRDQRKNEN